MRKQMIALLVSLAMLVSGIALAAAPAFSDVPNAFWAYNDIERCYEKGIVNGVGNNRFDPDNTLTYAQFYTIIARAFYNDEVKASTNSSDDWYSAHIRVLNTKGLLTNSASGAPKIDLSDKALSNGISRYDMAVLMYNIAKENGDADSWKTLRGDELNDFSRMPEYYRTAVLWCYAESLLKGYDDNLFHGDYTVTRAQACTVVCRLMDYVGNDAPQKKSTAQPVDPGQGTGGSPGANPVEPSVTGQKTAVPAGTNLTYNGTEQTGVAEGVGYTLTGNTATNAGSYTATATLKANYCWEDGSTGTKTIEWSIAGQKIAAPVGANLTYNGTKQTGVAEGVGYTLTGNTATEAGSYTATATLKANYCWEDGSTGTKTVNWSIARSVTGQKTAVPAGANLTYNETEQTGVAEGVGYTLTGNTATNAGSYTATATLKANYCWEDGSTGTKTIEWSIARQKIAVPVGATNLTYNGTKQTGVVAGEGYTLTGNTATEAGSYTATATLKANYCWSDGSTGTKTVNWSITGQKIAVPAGATNLTYNGTKQTGVVAGEGYTLTGNTATNAGSYTATATLKANYCWEDGSTGTKTIEWSIERATPVANGDISITYYVSDQMDVDGGMNVSGDFSFGTKPTNGINTALFTPKDTTNYKSVTVSVSVTLDYRIATPKIKL